MLSGALLEDAVLFNATRKIANPPDKVLFLGMMAGFWVGLGGLAAVSAAGGVPEAVRSEWVSLPKFLIGTFFAFGLHFIVMFGGDLFTGNTMVLAIGYYNRVISLRSLLLNWFIVYIGNWAGTLLVAYFFGYLTGLFDHHQYRSFLNELVHTKLESLSWGEIFLRAIPANTMVCMAYMLGIAARGASGKIIALWFPVVMFVVAGFEHCVANMFFTSLSLMYGAESSIGRLWYNQSAAVCGNVVGGTIFIGLTAHLMNHWKSPISGSRAAGTLMAHDVESTRRARDSDLQPTEDNKCPSRTSHIPATDEKTKQARSNRESRGYNGATVSDAYGDNTGTDEGVPNFQQSTVTETDRPNTSNRHAVTILERFTSWISGRHNHQGKQPDPARMV